MLTYRKAAGALLALALLGSQSALADTLQTFNLSGTFANGAVLGGSLVINTTTGVITTAAVTLSSPFNATISSIYTQGLTSFANTSTEAYSYLGKIPATSDTVWLDFETTTLVGYTGGAFYSTTDPVSYDNNSNPIGSLISGQYGIQVTQLVSGSATAAAVPEPSSLALLGVGLLGFGAITRRRTA